MVAVASSIWLLFFLLEYETRFTHYRPHWLNINSDNYPARGGIYGVMVQQPYEMGYKGVKTIHEYLLGKKDGVDDIATDVIFVNADNLDKQEF